MALYLRAAPFRAVAAPKAMSSRRKRLTERVSDLEGSQQGTRADVLQSSEHAQEVAKIDKNSRLKSIGPLVEPFEARRLPAP